MSEPACLKLAGPKIPRGGRAGGASSRFWGATGLLRPPPLRTSRAAAAQTGAIPEQPRAQNLRLQLPPPQRAVWRLQQLKPADVGTMLRSQFLGWARSLFVFTPDIHTNYVCTCTCQAYYKVVSRLNLWPADHRHVTVTSKQFGTRLHRLLTLYLLTCLTAHSLDDDNSNTNNWTGQEQLLRSVLLFLLSFQYRC